MSSETVVPERAADSTRGGATSDGRAAAARVSLPDVALPVDDLDEALPHLRRPFSPEAIKFKVQTVWPKGANPKGCVIVSYIDARLVIERLNAVVGGRWHAEYGAVAGNDRLLRCDLTVCDVTRRDVGESAKKMSKDLISDALKRAAVHFGVGVSVYALPQVSWRLAEKPGLIEKRGDGEKTTIVLTDRGHEQLRSSYRGWLMGIGEPAYGDVLDHGDVFEDVDPDAVAAVESEAFEPELPAALEDEEAVGMIGEARALYAEISGDETARRSFPPAMFDTWLRQSHHSHAALAKLIEHVRERRDQLLGGGA